MSDARAKALGLKPLGRFVAYATAGCPPEEFGIGPVYAIPKALKLAGLKLEDIAVIELNEAFAAQSLAVIQQARLDAAKVNPNGGAIALGHPLGCTGAKLTATILRELARKNARYGMVTMCIGGGMGAAGIIERLCRDGQEGLPRRHREHGGKKKRRRLFARIERLPQFDFVAVGIVYPGEAAVAFVLALRIDLDACFRQAIEQCIEVVDDVVHHERSFAGLEVFGGAGENAPDCHLLTFRVVFFTPRKHDTMAAIREAEMFCVPLLHLLLIRGLEEDTADAEDPALLAHGCCPFL
jgi:hypothetical protein